MAKSPAKKALKLAEQQRLDAANSTAPEWRDWGPYVAERAWGTVREDYSADGDAWSYFPHEHARSRAYRWNEDGMAAFCDLEQNWVLGLSLWNGRDAILKERMFGLSGHEGNHGEDVKEYWWYTDGTPTHSWQGWRYHYPQAAFPYELLVDENARRDRLQPEFELADTGVFDDGRYWVVEASYAKAGPHDLLLTLAVTNAGPDAATIEVLPTIWFRNTWAWDEKDAAAAESAKYVFSASAPGTVSGSSPAGALTLSYEADAASGALFCDNETNAVGLFGSGARNASPYPKDGIGDHIVTGAATVNPDGTGTKAAVRYTLTVAPGATQTVRLRLSDAAAPLAEPFADFDDITAARRAEADAFHKALAPRAATKDEKRVLRQAFAGLSWSKQFFHYDVRRWLDGDAAFPPPPAGRGTIRNGNWRHLVAHDVILMPDPWEYPWFASWDLGFHCMTMAHFDPEFAKAQLVLILREWYLHPNGQLPAYEWDFGDVNPPTQAHAALEIFRADGGRDTVFLARVFHKLLMNFTWWIDNRDREGDQLFDGGFMGLDNIAPINRSTLPPQLGTIEQADATAWVAMYALDLLEIAVELTKTDPAYEDVAITFFERFLTIADAANDAGLWNEEDAFYYDVLTLPGSQQVPLRVKSLVGLVPVVASVVLDGAAERLPDLRARITAFLTRSPELARAWVHPRETGKNMLALTPPERLERILAQVFDESGMLSPHGIRSISAWHRGHPFELRTGGVDARVDYEPAESTSALFGGNSNWRGPVWLPLNALLINALRNYDTALGETHTVEYPAGSGVRRSFGWIADELSTRLVSLFTLGPDGSPRPSDAAYPLLSTDPRWRDNVLFYEYFHGDTGQGLGASHQTGWTALVARLILKRGTGWPDDEAPAA